MFPELSMDVQHVLKRFELCKICGSMLIIIKNLAQLNGARAGLSMSLMRYKLCIDQ